MGATALYPEISIGLTQVELVEAGFDKLNLRKS